MNRHHFFQGIEFLAEQVGVPEREFKAELCHLFREIPAVYRAFLAVVRYLRQSSYYVGM